jgi:hypothetical protein
MPFYDTFQYRLCVQQLLIYFNYFEHVCGSLTFRDLFVSLLHELLSVRGMDVRKPTD